MTFSWDTWPGEGTMTDHLPRTMKMTPKHERMGGYGVAHSSDQIDFDQPNPSYREWAHVWDEMTHARKLSRGGY